MIEEKKESIESAFTVEELQQILLDKQIEANEAKAAMVKLQAENNSLVTRSLKVYEENQMYKASPELAAQMAEMEFHLKMAERFIASKAFKAENAEQAYVIIKAGSEMGMKPVESMQALYCVNGAVKFHGDKMVSRITKAGYKIEYLEETDKSVVVKVTNENGFEAVEKVTDQDQIIQRSKAAGFAKKNKMRFHGVRMIASFHLPHLFSSVQDEFTSDFNEWEDATPQLKSGIDLKQIDQSKERERILQHINKSKSANELQQVVDHIHEFDLVDEYNSKLETFREL